MIRSLFVLLVAFPVSARAADSKLAEPVAAFTLADGWVDFRLERDGRPVKGARVTVLVGNQIWAQGETGDTGEGTFPRPGATDCQVVFNLGSGPSAPIPLAFIADGTMTPARSPVRDGAAECCERPRKSVSAKPTPNERPAYAAVLAAMLLSPFGIAATFVLVSSLFLGWLLWQTSTRSTQHIRKSKRERR